MSKFNNNKKVYSFQQFQKLDGDVYKTYDIAWPVEVIECFANKVADGLLNALEEAVLELLTVPEVTPKRIAELLDVSKEVVDKIVNDLGRGQNPYYDSEKKVVTEYGRTYLQKKETGDFVEEQVFGNMFVSRVNGEVFPFFREGKLPWGRQYNDILYLSFDGEEPSTLKADKTTVLDKVNKAFHEYGRITKSSKEQAREFGERQVVEFVAEELKDQSYHVETESLADVEASKNLRNARVKILDTKPKEIYVRCRLSVSKAAPEKFIIESPFQENITPWYSQSFYRLMANKEMIYLEDEEETSLQYFCEEMVTKQFYIDFPEMQSNNFEQYVKIHFPKMLSCSITGICMDKYKEVFNYRLLCDKSEVKRHIVVTEATKALELILNNYIARTDRDDIMEKYKKNVQSEREIEDLFDEFGIKDCSAQWSETKKMNNGRLFFNNSCMSHFQRGRDGHSVVEKYHYLVAEANYNEKSKFRKLLLTEGTDIIAYLDFINNKRNKFGAHNDGTKPVEISDEDFKIFNDYYLKATKLLIEYID